MSFAIDVNVLLYASDAGSARHSSALRFLEGCASGHEVFCVAWTTLMSYLRIATHPSVFGQPLSPADAHDNVTALLELPHLRVLSEEEGFWDIYREVTRRVPTRGNLVPDAHLVALLRQHGVRKLYTVDRDFLKFDGLDVEDPLQE